LSPPQRERIEANAFVSLECMLRNDEGDCIEGDEAASDVEYVHGYGMLVPGLEVALHGLVAGDVREVVVAPADGYGDRDEELVMEVDRTDFPEPSKVVCGDEFVAEFPDGETQAMRVVEVLPESVVVDANHPLAGMTLRYLVRVKGVRPATEDEIETAARELAEAEEGDACGCGDDHPHGTDHAHEQLIPLGRRKSTPDEVR
jgi:FKBP-type peptidyl-prolyl cis-trans isomerase SlyD